MSNRRYENSIRQRKGLLLGGCALLLMTLGADKPAPDKIALKINGWIVPVRQVSVGSKVAGEIVDLPIEEGQKVKKGDVLARLDPAEFEAELRLARARVNLAVAHVAKAKEGGSKADLAIAEAKVEVARVEYGIAEHRLDGCTVRAPVSGTVLVKRVEVGTRVDPRGSTMSFSSVCDLADLQALEVELFVPDQDAPLCEKGQKCLIRLPGYPKMSYKGRVTRFLPVADRAKGCVNVRVRIEVPEPDDRLRPDQVVTVQVLRKE
jgi:RND family efflux transporter MFP subunit